MVIIAYYFLIYIYIYKLVGVCLALRVQLMYKLHFKKFVFASLQSSSFGFTNLTLLYVFSKVFMECSIERANFNFISCFKLRHKIITKKHNKKETKTLTHCCHSIIFFERSTESQDELCTRAVFCNQSKSVWNWESINKNKVFWN